MSGPPAAVRLYAALLRLLPRPVRDADGAEMVAAFEALWDDAVRRGGRAGCLLRTVGRLPRVAALEWWDHLRAAGGRRASSKGGRTGMDGTVRTLRHAARGLLRTPAFSASAVLLLGLGVGAVTTIFTLVDHVLLRPLPYPAAERLVRIENGSHSAPDVRDFQASIPSVEAWAAASRSDVNLTGSGEPVRLREARVTEGFFPVFGGRPVAGRLLVPSDYAAADVAVLSASAWDRLFGGDPGVVGRTLRVDGAPVLVVGVLDPSFVVPEAIVDRRSPDLWRPVDRTDESWDRRDYHLFSVAGRLRPGATLEDVRRDAAAVAAARAQTFPEQYVRRDGTLRELPVVPLQEATVGRARQGLELLLAAVTLLLLVACANVAHLFMARSLARGREIAVRRALGAGRRALAGQLLAESLLVAAAGAAVGLVLAAAGLRAFLALQPTGVPRAGQVALDPRVVAFAVAVSALTAVVFGLVPGLRMARGDAAHGLRSGGRAATGGRRVQGARAGLVVAEVALSLVLVTQAALLLRSFTELHRVEPGFRIEGVWTLPLNLRGVETADAWRGRMERVREAVTAVAGVRDAAYGLEMPLEWTTGTCCWSSPVRRPGEEGGPQAMGHPASDGYFHVLDLAFVAGRAWRPGDVASTPSPAVVTEGLAVELHGSAAAAVGREVQYGPVQLRVVGVVADNHHYGPDRDPVAGVYLPPDAIPFAPHEAHLAVWVDGASDDLAARLREAVWSVEPDLPVPTVRSMEGWSAIATAGTRFDSVLFGAFGVAALLLAAGGLYGTLLYTVGLERRELGIRLALGAARRSIEGRVLARGLRMVAVGAALGGAGAWAAGRLVESRLFGVTPGDPAALAGAAAALLATAAIACWLPARRAAATDPIQTLREE